jgi:hypothetical protein
MTGRPRGVVLAVCAVLLAIRVAAAKEEHADLVLRNGVIATVDPRQPRAQALAVRGERIVRVGTDAEIVALAGPKTQVIDLAGRFAMPGFIEGHGHLMMLGQSMLSLDLSDARSWDEVVARVAGAVKKANRGEWIIGVGWHQERWSPLPAGETSEGLPAHHALSAVSPENPVALTHASGHASFANAKAMQLAGITRDSKDPDGPRRARGGAAARGRTGRDGDARALRAPLSRCPAAVSRGGLAPGTCRRGRRQRRSGLSAPGAKPDRVMRRGQLCDDERDAARTRRLHTG